MRRPATVLTAVVFLAGCTGQGAAEPSAPPSSRPATTTSTSTSTTSTSTTSTSTSSTSTTSTTVPPTTTTVASVLETPPTDPRYGPLTDALVAASVGRGDRAVSIAVVEQGRLVHTATVGDGLTPASGFRLASASKPLVATTVLQLAAEGRIRLDDPVVDQFGLGGPFRDPRTADITVRQLMSHTSGLPARKDLFFRTTVGDWRINTLVAIDQPLQFTPGTGYQYSNLNYVVLGTLLEHVTGDDLETVLDERIGAALGAGTARLAGTFDSRPGEATYASGAGRHYMEMLGPAGGMVATAAYMALAAGTVSAALPEMRRPATPFRANRNFDYGLGTMIFDGGWFGHSGSIEATRTLVVTSPTGVTVAVLISGESFGTGESILPVVQGALS